MAPPLILFTCTAELAPDCNHWRSGVMIDADTWMIFDRAVQWLILPAVAVIWSLNNRVSRQEQEILRILTILEERKEAHVTEQKNVAVAFRELRQTIEKLSEKLDKVGRL